MSWMISRGPSCSVSAADRAAVESLEKRTLFAAPHVTSVIADNRGEVIFQMDADMNASTVNSRSVFMHTAGTDGTFGTLDDQKIYGRVRYFAGNRRITFRSTDLPVNAIYSLKLNAKRIRGADGSLIDGDFNGAGTASGNGTAGGDFLCITRKTTSAQTARFSTASGAFNVSLFNDKTPKNAANFVKYANVAAWDGTFLHRSLPNFVIQGGGFRVTKANQLDQIGEFTPVDNEPGVTSSTRGTIALARPDDQNPATDDKGSNQWFFNLADNSANLDSQNGGFTAFGQITSEAGLAVMDALAAFPTINAGGTFSNLPVVNSNVTAQEASSNPLNALILIRRVAILNKVSAYA